MTGSREDSSLRDRIRGCLLGGAIGDALGASIEFLSLSRIRDTYGPAGLTDLASAYGRIGAITDDTQMTLFTAEGLIRAFNRIRSGDSCIPATVIRNAYQRWYQTQGNPWTGDPDHPYAPSGWLVSEDCLHSRCAPGGTCLAGLRDPVAPDIANNNSKGCGGVMRMAPVGFVGDRWDPFDLGCAAASITHGHPTGYLASGAFALIIDGIVRGESLTDATQLAIDRLRMHPDHVETVTALEAALKAAATNDPPSAEAVVSLGEGWIAEEALAIGVYCALEAEDFRHGLLLAVNHGGDSDSTGSIAGNLLGAMWGAESLPARWLEQLEARELIERLATDLAMCLDPDTSGPVDLESYPGW